MSVRELGEPVCLLSYFFEMTGASSVFVDFMLVTGISSIRRGFTTQQIGGMDYYFPSNPLHMYPHHDILGSFSSFSHSLSSTAPS